MEILTNILSEEQIGQELADTMAFLLDRNLRSLHIFRVHPRLPDLDDLGIDYAVAIENIEDLMADRERNKGFRLGLVDCWISQRVWTLGYYFAMIAMFISSPSQPNCLNLLGVAGKVADTRCIPMIYPRTTKEFDKQLARLVYKGSVFRRMDFQGRPFLPIFSTPPV